MAEWRRYRLSISRFLICGALGFGLYGTAGAGMVSTQDAIDATHMAQTRAQMKVLLQRPELAEELKALGVSPADARTRVDAMTDDEVLALAGKVGNLPAGGRLSNNELILILIIILILVL
ncbi:MAG TPA: PA2779 family protein [Burkholderiales bacterium]